MTKYMIEGDVADMRWSEYTKGNLCLIVLAVENEYNMAEYLKWHKGTCMRLLTGLNTQAGKKEIDMTETETETAKVKGRQHLCSCNTFD